MSSNIIMELPLHQRIFTIEEINTFYDLKLQQHDISFKELINTLKVLLKYTNNFDELFINKVSSIFFDNEKLSTYNEHSDDFRYYEYILLIKNISKILKDIFFILNSKKHLLNNIKLQERS